MGTSIKQACSDSVAILNLRGWAFGSLQELRKVVGHHPGADVDPELHAKLKQAKVLLADITGCKK